MREFSRRSDLSNVDSCFVIISSHGTEDEEHHTTEILGVDSGREDSEKVLCTDILAYFNVEACPQMANKPKIFIFQLCRYVVIVLRSFMPSVDSMLSHFLTLFNL